MLTRFAIEVTTTTLVKGHDEWLTDIQYFAGTYALVAKIRLSDTVTKTFATEDEALERIKTLRPYQRYDNSLSVYTFGVREVKYTHANQHGHSDVYPFEIVRAVSDKTIELRSMAAERAADWKPEIVSGGYAGHCTNNGNQSKAWVIKSDPDGEVVRARLQKDGSWKSSHGRHKLHTNAIKKYDYNF